MSGEISNSGNSSAKTGKLVYVEDARELQFREYPVPSPKAGAVVTEVVQTNVCGSDIHVWRGDHPLEDCVLGHEAVCRISELGKEVDTDSAGQPVERGDLVAPVYFQTCQHCEFCRRGEFYRCANDYEFAGQAPDVWPHFHATWGTHYYIHPTQNFYKLPPELEETPKIGAAANCALSQVIFGLKKVGVEYNDTVVIQGAGGLGLYATAFASQQGANTIVVEGVQTRLERAREFGADHVVDMNEYETPEARATRVRDLTDGTGADVVVEVAGVPEAFNEGIKFLRTAGRYLVMGNVRPGHSIKFDPGALVRKSVDVTSVVEYDPWTLYDALAFLAETIDMYPHESLIDAQYDLQNVTTALRDSEKRTVTRATLSTQDT
mgnify:CR=1 FL=1|jgi:D-arabinose 1-dehydrogenase-like Zn-dependent alcohol dehydrogenase